MLNSILDDIEKTKIAKEKGSHCSKIIRDFITGQNQTQLEQFWEILNSTNDYHIYIQNELLKQLL